MRAQHSLPPAAGARYRFAAPSFGDSMRPAPMRAHALEDHLAAAIAATWTGAVPAIALHTLWSRNEAAGAYAIAAALSPLHRSPALAWCASLDPQPRSARAVKASTEALRGAQGDLDLTVALALVPLRDPAVLRLATHLASGVYSRRAIALRTDRDAKLDDDPTMPEDSVLFALQAARRADQGRDDEAKALMERALTRGYFALSWIAQAVLPAVRRLGAWGAIGQTQWEEVPLLAAAFLAGREGPGAVDALVSGLGERASLRPILLAAAALGHAQVPDESRPELAACDPALAQEHHDEGLVSREELWALRVAHALGNPYPEDPQIFALEQAALAICDACKEAYGFADRVRARLAGPSRDEARVAKRAASLAELVRDPKEKDRPRPTWRSLRPILRKCRALADEGGAAEVRDAVSALEKLWGPAEGWMEGELTSTTAEHVVELLSCAAGRSQEAARIERAQRDVYPSVRARLCAGLARDGHLDELRDVLERTIGERLEPSDVELLAPAAVALDPAAAERVEETLVAELCGLPETPFGVVRFLREAKAG
jgi:hypothetical protein